MTITLIDVAARAGVSLSTASRVLSKSTYGVAEELRERVLAAAEELRYVPNAHARALVRNKTSTVGVIVGDVSDPYFSEIVRGIQRVAGEAGRLVTICNSYREPDRELSYVELLHAQRVEAIVLAGSGLDDLAHSRKMASRLEAFADSGGKVSLIGRHHLLGDRVVPDNFGGARALGEALLGLGHRRFGVLSGPKVLTSTHDRLAGFRAALGKAGVALHPKGVVDGDLSRDGGARATQELLDRALGVTAVFAMNDQQAIGALAALRERGVAVPGEISLAGFDDIPIACDLNPQLSTVRLPLVEMGERALLMALRPSDPELRVEHLRAEVILRSSTAPRE
jgi:LacI family transcriptional regulator